MQSQRSVPYVITRKAVWCATSLFALFAAGVGCTGAGAVRRRLRHRRPGRPDHPGVRPGGSRRQVHRRGRRHVQLSAGRPGQGRRPDAAGVRGRAEEEAGRRLLPESAGHRRGRAVSQPAGVRDGRGAQLRPGVADRRHDADRGARARRLDAADRVGRSGASCARRRARRVRSIPTQEAGTELFRASIRDLESGALSQNIELRDGDTIFVPRAETAYVFGQVKNPGAYALQKDTTVLQALSLAGGVTENGAMNRMRVMRIVDGDQEGSQGQADRHREARRHHHRAGKVFLMSDQSTLEQDPQRRLRLAARTERPQAPAAKGGAPAPAPLGFVPQDISATVETHLLDYVKVLYKRRWTAIDGVPARAWAASRSTPSRRRRSSRRARGC